MGTQTFELSPAEIRELRNRLEAGGFEFTGLAYAHFSARIPGVVVNAYRSGKVVVQGREAADATERWLSGLGTGAARAAAAGLPGPPIIGTDEAGKGDYFGPLVAAGVVVRSAADETTLARLGVRDCKGMADSAVLFAAAAIRKALPHATAMLAPAAYNRAHAAVPNVNRLLADLHAAVIADLRGQCPDVDRVLVDKFAAAEVVERALAKREVEARLHQVPRAEVSPAVAAASVLARAEFLISLEKLGNEAGESLPKGGANARIYEVGGRILSVEGRVGLNKVAKVHFKTTQKLRG
jgi:ribonuclease HIII